MVAAHGGIIHFDQLRREAHPSQLSRPSVPALGLVNQIISYREPVDKSLIQATHKLKGEVGHRNAC